MADQSAPRALEFRGISKRFGGANALSDVSFAIEPGTIHAIVGENGAGKSTLGKIVGGLHAADSGTMLLDGREVSYSSPRQALADGIAMIHQELALVPKLSAAANVFLGDERSRAGFLQPGETNVRFTELASGVGFDIDPRATLDTLSIAQQQQVEILRALARRARIIVMDEPTSALSRSQADHLHGVMRSLRDDGMTILYVSHFLEEVIATADVITVLRNGRHVSTTPTAEMTVSALVGQMLGSAAESGFPEKAPEPDRHGDPILTVEGLTQQGTFHDVSFDVFAGEVVGLAGLVGSGRSEVARCVAGVDRPTAGSATVRGRRVRRPGYRSRVGLVPEDRRKEGLVMGETVRMNATLPHLDVFASLGFVRRKDERRAVKALLDEVRVSPPDAEMRIGMLSGGNQQKVLIGRWLIRRPDVLIFDEPTRGVDVGAKRAIYALVNAVARAGHAVIVISSDHSEVAGLAHRVLVMGKGRIMTELRGNQVSTESIGGAALGY